MVYIDIQAREAGTSQKKYIMVNIQNVREFVCQALNRDVWSNASVKAVLQEHFIFWQVVETVKTIIIGK